MTIKRVALLFELGECIRGVMGIFGGTVKCVKIGKNTNDKKIKLTFILFLLKEDLFEKFAKKSSLLSFYKTLYEIFTFLRGILGAATLIVNQFWVI